MSGAHGLVGLEARPGVPGLGVHSVIAAPVLERGGERLLDALEELSEEEVEGRHERPMPWGDWRQTRRPRKCCLEVNGGWVWCA